VILQEITTAKSLNVAVTTTTRGSSCCKASTTQNDLLSRRQIALATLLAGVSFATNLSIHGEEAEAVSSSRRAVSKWALLGLMTVSKQDLGFLVLLHMPAFPSYHIICLSRGVKKEQVG
jgi:hypothetical protein